MVLAVLSPLTVEPTLGAPSIRSLIANGWEATSPKLPCLGAPGPNFGTWESTGLNHNARNYTVDDLKPDLKAIAARRQFKAAAPVSRSCLRQLTLGNRNPIKLVLCGLVRRKRQPARRVRWHSYVPLGSLSLHRPVGVNRPICRVVVK